MGEVGTGVWKTGLARGPVTRGQEDELAEVLGCGAAAERGAGLWAWTEA